MHLKCVRWVIRESIWRRNKKTRNEKHETEREREREREMGKGGGRDRKREGRKRGRKRERESLNTHMLIHMNNKRYLRQQQQQVETTTAQKKRRKANKQQSQEERRREVSNVPSYQVVHGQCSARRVLAVSKVTLGRLLRGRSVYGSSSALRYHLEQNLKLKLLQENSASLSKQTNREQNTPSSPPPSPPPPKKRKRKESFNGFITTSKLEAPCKNWRPLAKSGGPLQKLEVPCKNWRPLAKTGDPLQKLEALAKTGGPLLSPHTPGPVCTTR